MSVLLEHSGSVLCLFVLLRVYRQYFNNYYFLLMYTVQYPPLGKSRHGGLFPPLNLAIIPWQIHNESIAKSTYVTCGFCCGVYLIPWKRWNPRWESTAFQARINMLQIRKSSAYSGFHADFFHCVWVRFWKLYPYVLYCKLLWICSVESAMSGLFLYVLYYLGIMVTHGVCYTCVACGFSPSRSLWKIWNSSQFYWVKCLPQWSFPTPI